MPGKFYKGDVDAFWPPNNLVSVGALNPNRVLGFGCLNNVKFLPTIRESACLRAIS